MANNGDAGVFDAAIEESTPDANTNTTLLQGIELSTHSQLQPEFADTTFFYDSNVSFMETFVVITPHSAFESAMISVNSTLVKRGQGSLPIPLNEGENTIDITITDGSESSFYSLVVRRGSLVERPAIANDGSAGEDIGESISMSGGFLVVGAPGALGAKMASNTGAAYVFSRNDSQWGQVDKLFLDEGASNDFFGVSVALSNDTIAVGAAFREFRDVGENITGDAGAVYIYRNNGGSWQLEKELFAPSPLTNAKFGTAISLEGNRLVVGAIKDKSESNSRGGGCVCLRARRDNMAACRQVDSE